jgi:four helix bundle protein
VGGIKVGTVQSFEELEIWKLAKQYYEKISVISFRLKGANEFRFADQVRSAAGSIMDNIAEGFERNSRLEFINSLSIAKGECGESMSQLYRLMSDKFITTDEFNELSTINRLLSKKIARFIIYLNNSGIRGLKFKSRRL